MRTFDEANNLANKLKNEIIKLLGDYDYHHYTMNIDGFNTRGVMLKISVEKDSFENIFQSQYFQKIDSLVKQHCPDGTFSKLSSINTYTEYGIVIPHETRF